MSTLYEAPPTRSHRVKWALEELHADYVSDKVDFSKGQHKLEQYLGIHPLGVVPAYSTDDYSMFESAAIVMQLLDERPACGLAPNPGSPERASYYQWINFAAAELDHRLEMVTQNEMILPEEKRRPELAQFARAELVPRADALNQHLSNNAYILGDSFSGADLVLGYNCFWGSFSGIFSDHPHILAYHEKLKKRTAYQKVFDG